MKYMSWSYLRSDYAMKEIYDYGDRFSQVGMFDYITEFIFINPNLGYFSKDNVSGVTGKINLDVNFSSTSTTARDSPTIWNSYMNWVSMIREKWPHIKWYLSVRNDGTPNAIQYLMDNVNSVQTVFLSEIERLIDENPWCAGIDIDLERCGGTENADKMVNLVKKISDVVHAKGKLLHYDLPAMNGEYWSVGSEDWCSYARLNPYLDSVVIMSYDFAWQGSAPSAVSPKWWLDIVYAYVAKSFAKEKVFMGLPGYGYVWQISEYPSLDTDSYYGRYRGRSLRYTEILQWQNGTKSHTETQALIPFASYINDDEKCANLFLHVYDIQSFEDAALIGPANKGTYKSFNYVSTYKKNIEYSFSGTQVDIKGNQYTKATGYVILIEQASTVEGGTSTYALTSATPITGGLAYQAVWGIAEFTFSCSGGSYELIFDINFMWFDKNIITVDLDGTRYEARMGSLYDTNAIKRHYVKVANVSLSSGSHTLKFLGEFSSPGALFYGFILCDHMTVNTISGEANYLIQPQTLYDVNMNPTKPNKYKLTFEVLRRNPDYCYIYSDDFRSYVSDFNIFTRYYTIISGQFRAVGSSTAASTLEQLSSTLDTEFRIKYESFSSICVTAQFNHNGVECGIVIGSNKVGIRGNYIVIYENDIEIKTIYTTRVTTGTNKLTVRVKGTQGKITLNSTDISTETLTASTKAGMYSKQATYECTLFEVRDSYNMYLQEGITVTTPNGVEQLGWIERTGVTNDEVNRRIYVGDGIEELSTRTSIISQDWDFLHSSEFSIDENFQINVKFDDIGLWLRRVFLVDSDGASVGFYNDIFSYMYWFNESSNTYGFNGCAIWCTGQQDPNIYKYLDKQV